MLKSQKIKVIEKLADDANLFFYSFQELDEHTFVANTHFFKFIFGPNHVTVEEKYILPSKEMEKYILENLPITLAYTTEKFYDVLLEHVDDMHGHLLYLERLQEENFTENLQD